MRALEFKPGHVIYNPAYTYKFQLNTTKDLCDEEKVQSGQTRVCYCNGHLCNTSKAGNNAMISSILLYAIFGFLVSK